MALEFVTSGGDSLAALFTSSPAAASADGKRALDPALGHGYIQLVDLGPQLKLMIHQYELHQAVQLRKLPVSTGRDTLLFSFRHVFQPAGARPAARARPTVRVSSAAMEFEQVAPAQASLNTLLLAADVSLFAALRSSHPPNALLETLLTSQQPLVYEALCSPQMQAVAAALIAADAPPELRPYYLKLKAEELLYLFLAELLKRTQAPLYPLNRADVQRLYALRDQLLADLSTVPHLPTLAQAAGLSESKLKRLFKQVFGITVYTYYQTARLQEAARLLREEQLPVSEVGHQLGFQNLSHFTRLFERHLGVKPKQFSKSQGGSPKKAADQGP